jgi:hypothetical protein
MIQPLLIFMDHEWPRKVLYYKCKGPGRQEYF